MITDQTSKIIQPENFWWKPNENKALFDMGDVIYNYDPYSIKFIEPTFPKMITIKRIVLLNILLGNTHLLKAGLEIDIHINTVSIETLREKLLKTGADAHDRFLISFKERCHQSCISKTYEPVFDTSIFLDKIEHLLQNEDGL